MTEEKTNQLPTRIVDGIIFSALPAIEPKIPEDWIEHFAKRNISMNGAAKKIIIEDLVVAQSNELHFAIITKNAMHGAEYSIENALGLAAQKGFLGLTVENACRMRDLLSNAQIAAWGLQGFSICFPDIKTHGPEYIKPGSSQDLQIGNHALHGDYFYSMPYGGNETIASDGSCAIAFLVPPDYSFD